jgi:hypothetical protein
MTLLSPTAEEDLKTLEDAEVLGQEAVVNALHFLETELTERSINREEYDAILHHKEHEPIPH